MLSLEGYVNPCLPLFGLNYCLHTRSTIVFQQYGNPSTANLLGPYPLSPALQN